MSTESIPVGERLLGARRHTLGWPLAVAAMAALVTGAVVWATAVGQTRLPGYPEPTTLAEVGFRIEPAGERATVATISEAEAIARADAAAGGLGDPRKPLSAQLVLLTDEHYGTFDAKGTFHPTIDRQLVWLVRFSGTPQPCYGLCGPGDPVATELNVVVDAVSGDVLLMTSFR